MKNIFKMFRFIIVFLLLHSSITYGNENTGLLKVGACKANINPPASMFPAEGEFVNYAGVHDPLFVRAIVIYNGIEKAALVTMDLAGVPSGKGEFINQISVETGIDLEYLYVSATHDHSTVRVGNTDDSSEYYTLILEATIQALKDADSKLQPARVGYATGKAYVNTARDEKIGKGYHMGYVPEGISDKTVAVISFTSLTGDPIAIYANYPVHAVVMYRATTKDGRPEVSGDLPGATSRYVEDHFEGAVALWSSGAAGDQNPLFMATYNQDHPDVFDTGVGGYAILEVLSRRLGEEIVRVTKSIKNTSSEVQIWAKKSGTIVPGRKRVTPRDPNRPRGGHLAETKVEMVDGDPITIPLHLLMINDIAFAGVAAEVFAEIGIHVKEQSLFDRTIMVTIMPDKVGYIPTDAAFLLPTEKALSNRFKPGYAEPAMIDALNKMMEEYISIKDNSYF